MAGGPDALDEVGGLYSPSGAEDEELPDLPPEEPLEAAVADITEGQV